MAGEGHKPYKLSIVPKTYTGRRDEDPEEWIEQFVHASESNFWNKEIMTKQFVNFLSGTPQRWYKTFIAKRIRDSVEEGNDEPATLTWDELKSGFLNAFVSVARDVVDEFKLDTRKQKPNETIEDYVYSILALCDRVDSDMSDERRVRKLLKGLLPSYLDKALPMNPETPEELLKILRSVAETKVIAGRNDDLTVFSIATEPIMTQLKQIEENTQTLGRKVDRIQAENKDQIDTLSKRVERIAMTRVTNDRAVRLAPVRCFRCNAAGHISTQCRIERRPTVQANQNFRDREKEMRRNEGIAFRTNVQQRFQPRLPMTKNVARWTEGIRPTSNVSREKQQK